ncbi:hypothetical protein Lsan_0039 [Legionella santicrucis]|uniref:DUF945 domain-containing protein n=1 Tax=Legionella santicrucis TaxID=45074 RepID=A0A0W0ZM50_9GAMM|nr:DUF932 domain-containing protein [Legionella santicrucis]KTD70357.1 hypothetical protein Lsan_0039 [Legionella santicrucis]
MLHTNYLTIDMLRRKAPSIFTQESAEHTSDKYQHISTINVIEGLMQEGFYPTWAHQSNCRMETKKAFTKHMIRFRHRDTKPSFTQLFPELVLVNSHNGLSSYRLNAGVFRLVCSNGLVAGHSYDELRVRHQGDIVGNIIEGTYKIIEDSQLMIESSHKMASVTLDQQEKQLFANAAHTLRFEDSEIGGDIASSKLLAPRRREEANANDLFTVFNIVQENVIKGGVSGYSKDSHGYPKRFRTRQVTGIDQSIKLNKALWTLAEKMMELKGGQ